MDITEADIIRMKESLAGIQDPRREWGNLRHKLIDMLVIALTTIIIGEHDFDAMEDWGLEREEWFRLFLELPNGIPDKDTFRRLFERIQPDELLACLTRWLSGEGERGASREVNIDGKTLRGSGKAGSQDALHVVSAWVGERNLVVGQVTTEEKSNEITAIPRLLDLVDIQGDVVTIDAMGCQTAIAEKIREKHGEYILAVKENQPALCQDIRDYFEYLDEETCRDRAADQWTGELEKDHGRIERRSVATVTALDWLASREHWPDLTTLIRYRGERTVGGARTVTDHYYISSMTASAQEFATMIRGHWSIENQLHWSLDVLFREDASQVRKDRAPENLNVLRKIALAKVRAASVPNRRLSTKRKIFKASVNLDFLYSVLFGK
jgi:predicted transposase YbfD/YdcC